MKKLLFLILITGLVWIYSPAQQKVVTISANQDRGPFNLVVGTNCGPHGFIYDIDYTQIFKDLGIKAIRTHDYYGPSDWYTIFPDWNLDPDNPASYNFTSTDSVIAKIVSGGFDVLFRIGPSWNDPVREYHTDPPGTIRDALGNVIHAADTSDFVKFANICKNIVRHYNEGWANGYFYNIKKWEVWNEPTLEEHFWSGTPLQFYHMFEKVVKTLKSYDSSLKVGGPGLAGGYKVAYREGLITYCSQNNIPLDFFSFHCYGWNPQTDLTTPNEYLSRAESLRQLLDSNGFFETYLSCDEWNAGLNLGLFANSGKGAAFYVCALAAFVDLNIPECYQYRADDHAIGLIRQDGSLKKAAYALKAWKMLAESTIRLETTGTEAQEFVALASRSSDHETMWILLSNFQNTTRQVDLRVNNISSQPANGWLMSRKVINNQLQLEEVESTLLDASNTLQLSIAIQPESVNLIRLTQVPIYAPLNFTGQKVLNRSLSQAEYINVLSWQPNPDNIEIANYRIYEVSATQLSENRNLLSRTKINILLKRMIRSFWENTSLSLLAEVSSNTIEYWHRGIEKNASYNYVIVAVNNSGKEGNPAYVTVQ